MQVEEVVRKVLVDEHADVLRESVPVAGVVVDGGRGLRADRRRPRRAHPRIARRIATAIARGAGTPRAGEIELQIPKIRQGSYFPSFLQPRKRSEQALLSVVQQAYACGVSTRRVDQLVESLGLRHQPQRGLTDLRRVLDEQVEAFRTRPLEGRYVYLFLDAKVEKVRGGGRVVRKCVVIAHGVHETGRREIIGLDVGAAETEAFWTDFVRLAGRARPGRRAAGHLRRPRRTEERDRQGLGCAVAALHCALPQGSAWSHARRDQHGLLAALIRPIFNARLARPGALINSSEAVAAVGGAKLPKVATLLEGAEDDILAFYAFPIDHSLQAQKHQPA